MEVFEVYNRSTNQWQSGGEIVSGWTENWVQDKTTDNMTLKTKYNGENAPNWKKGDWCRVLHLSGNEENATYTQTTGSRVKQISTNYITLSTTSETDENNLITYTISIGNSNSFELLEPLDILITDDGVTYSAILGYPDFEYKYKTFSASIIVTKESVRNIWVVSKRETIRIPNNHEQFLIKDATFAKNEIAGDWDCQLTLEEPIEMANGISIETRSFTNQISKVVDNTTYSHKSLNHLNVLETILKTTPANNNYEKSWFTRIGIIDRDLLSRIPYNDETLSEQTLYGLLLDKYDSSVGRTPVLYFDISTTEDLPNNLTKTTYVLDFLRQDGIGKTKINLSSLTTESIDYIINKSNENFVDGIVSNFSNLATNKEITFASENLWVIPEIDNNNRSIIEYDNNSEKGIWILRTPHKIKTINKLIRYHFQQSNYTENWSKDITEINVFEQKQYNISNDFDTRNVDWFVEGEQKIHLNDFYYKSSSYSNTDLYLYRVEYEPFVNARFDLGKDFNIQINQNDSQIDNLKYGKYLKAYLNSMNKSDIIITKNVENFTDIVDVGTPVVDENNNYLITSVGIQNRDYDYTVTYQLNQNHFRKNDSIVASQEIRENIEIAVDATKERKSMIAYEFNLDLEPVTTNDELNIKDQVFSSIITNSANKYPQTALLYIKNENKIVQDERLCNIARFPLNNTFCLNMTYFDNAEAGKQKTIDTTGTYVYHNGQQAFYTYLQGSPNSQKPVLYTDYFGELPIFDVKLLHTDTTEIENVDISSFTSAEQYGNYMQNVIKHIRYSTSYPNASGNFLSDFASEIENPVVNIENINYYKDMLDTFNYTIGLHINTNEDIILCDEFFNNSNLMTQQNSQNLELRTYIHYKDETDDFSNYIEKTDITSSLANNEITINMTNVLDYVLSAQTRVKSVAIVNKDNENTILIINNVSKIISGDTFQSIKLYC